MLTANQRAHERNQFAERDFAFGEPARGRDEIRRPARVTPLSPRAYRWAEAPRKAA